MFARLCPHSEREHTATNERDRRQQYQQIAPRGQRGVSFFLFDVDADCRTDEKNLTVEAHSGDQTQMHFRGRKSSHGYTTAADAMADEQRSGTELESPARIPAVESPAGNDEWWPPR